MIHRDEKGRVFEAHYEKTSWGEQRLVLDEEIDVEKMRLDAFEVLIQDESAEQQRYRRQRWREVREG